MAKSIRRICLLNPQGYVTHPAPLGKTDTGGQTLYVLQLAKALGAQGIKVDIFVRKFDELSKNEKPWPNVEIIRVPCGPKTFVRKEGLYDLMSEFTENIMLLLEEKRYKYDVIHSHYWDGGYAGVLLAKMLDVPHIHTPHSLGKAKKMEMDVKALPVKKLAPVYHFHKRIAIEQKIMNKAKAIVVICETSRIEIFQHYTVDFDKVHVRYPGIDTEYFNTKKNGADKRVKLKPNSILTVSRLVPAKGIDRIVKAVAKLKKKNFHLYIAGGSSHNGLSTEEKYTQNELNALIKKHRLVRKVSFVGFVDHDKILPAYYRSADVFILGGRYEPFGLTTLEAMACGTVPVVSTAAGSREVIIDGLNGFIVNTSNITLLARLISKVLADSKTKKRISQNASQTIQDHYSWKKVASKFINLYKRFL
jgi:mannosylfructose-phosphate synthase